MRRSPGRSGWRAVAGLLAFGLVITACSSSTTSQDQGARPSVEAREPTGEDGSSAVSPSPLAAPSQNADPTGVGPSGEAGSDGGSTSTTGTSSSTAGTSGGATGGTSSGAAGDGGTTGQPPPSSEPPSPIKIGFAIPSGNSGAAFGVEYSSNADLGRKAINALMAEVNERGGFGGRHADHVIVEVDQTDQSQNTQQRLQTEACLTLTEDENVDLVLSSGVTHAVHDCFAKHETPLLDELVVADDQQFNRHQPWLLPPMWLNASRLAKLMPLVMDDAEVMSRDIGVLSFDNARDRRLIEEVLTPEIEGRGGRIRDVVYMSQTYDAVAAGTNSAVLRFKEQGIDTVLVWASLSGTWGLFAQQAESQQYRPRYVVSTYQTPRTAYETGIVPPNQIRNTVGAGFFALMDQSGSALPPVSDRERACWEIVNEREGTDIQSRDQGDQVTGLCDAVFITEAALAPAAGGPLTRHDIPGWFHGLGSGYDPIRFNSVHLSSDVLDALGSYATFAFDEQGCDCFAYQHEFRPIPFAS